MRRVLAGFAEGAVDHELPFHVRIYPDSGHSMRFLGSLLWAKSGHQPRAVFSESDQLVTSGL
jgi:hypothetical protein